jgi:hypothetical protein
VSVDGAAGKQNTTNKRPSRAVKKEESEDDEPAAKKPKKTVTVGKKKKATEQDTETKAESEERDPTPIMKTVIKKGKAPVDEICPLAGAIIRKSCFRPTSLYANLRYYRHPSCLCGRIGSTMGCNLKSDGRR